MVFFDRVGLNKAIEDMKVLLQDALVTLTATFEYDAGTTLYSLDGYTTDKPNLVEIVSIEGESYEGNYVNEGELEEGTDYSLYDDYGTVPDGYGNSTGRKLYRYLSIQTNTFADGTKVTVVYRYFNPEMVPKLTDFSSGSVLNMLVTSILLNYGETTQRVKKFLDSFGINATGEQLDNIAAIAGLQRESAEKTRGKIKIVNNGTDTYTISPSFRFVSYQAGRALKFVPLNSVTAGAGQTVWVDVEAEEEGSLYNVGAYSINTLYEDDSLGTPAPDTIVVTNPPVDANGDENYFDNGRDEESDYSLRERMVRAFMVNKTASYTVLENAAMSTGLIDSAVAYDIDNKKGMKPFHVQLYVSSDNVLSQTTMDIIKTRVDQVKPVGTVLQLKQPMSKYISPSLKVFVSRGSVDKESLSQQIKEALEREISLKGIGEDVLPSSFVFIAKNQSGVRDVEITGMNYTLFTSEFVTPDNTHYLMQNGTVVNDYALQLPFNAHTAEEVFDYDGSTTIFTVSNTPIDDRVAPVAYKAVIGYDGSYRPSPLNRSDFYISNTKTTVTVDPNADEQDPLVAGEKVLINYNYYKETTIDGVRVFLGGTAGTKVKVAIYTGASEPTSLVAGTEVTEELNGGEELVEFRFSAPVTLSPADYTYWIVVTADIAGNSGDAYLPSSSAYTYIPFSPMIKKNEGGTWLFVYEVFRYESFFVVPSEELYKRIIVPDDSVEPERARPYNVQVTVEETDYR